MRKIYYVLGLGALMFGLLTGCDSDAQNEENSKETKPMETTQTETSTEETKNVNDELEALGYKSTDIHTYITDQRSEKEYYDRYEIECENPLILKIEDKDEDSFTYMGTYSYYSLSGKVFQVGNQWYEIPGFRNYKECLLLGCRYYWLMPYEDKVMSSLLHYGIFDEDERNKGQLKEDELRYNIENNCYTEYNTKKWFKYETDGNVCNVYMRADSEFGGDEIVLYGYCIINENYGVTFNAHIIMKEDTTKEEARKIRDEIENGKLLEEMFSVRKVKK